MCIRDSLLAIGDGEGDVAQGRGTAAVAEGDILELNVTVDFFHLGDVYKRQVTSLSMEVRVPVRVP